MTSTLIPLQPFLLLWGLASLLLGALLGAVVSRSLRRQRRARPWVLLGQLATYRPWLVERNQCRRLLSSLVRGVAEDGYGAVGTATLADRAGLTPRTFFRYFESVEQCYLIAFDLHARELAEILELAWRGEEDWPLRVRAAIAASLDFFADSPQLAPLLLTEPFLASQTVFRHHQRELVRLLPFIAEGRSRGEWGAGLPESTERGLLGALAFQIARKAASDQPDQFSALLDELTQFVLTPYLGIVEARRISAD